MNLVPQQFTHMTLINRIITVLIAIITLIAVATIMLSTIDFYKIQTD